MEQQLLKCLSETQLQFILAIWKHKPHPVLLDLEISISSWKSIDSEVKSLDFNVDHRFSISNLDFSHRIFDTFSFVRLIQIIKSEATCLIYNNALIL